MNPGTVPQGVAMHNRFGMWALLEFVTVCSILLALSGVVGMAASVMLALMALALAAKRGAIALAAFMAVILASNWTPQLDAYGHSGITGLFAAAFVVAWYYIRNQRPTSQVGRLGQDFRELAVDATESYPVLEEVSAAPSVEAVCTRPRDTLIGAGS